MNKSLAAGQMFLIKLRQKQIFHGYQEFPQTSLLKDTELQKAIVVQCLILHTFAIF